ncbi:hypothetical protein MKN04_05545 [Paenibacillus polymyxa]|uniref:hypothetical protein n=1 Tax=Paenibacillus polymyxa TaxID=1406 RepID=UPI0012D33AD0|nr:hypothetical protein [Paenibacillus polymyxa]MCH6187120.1 hypothetical protein [Paenibacillus polymyxa]MDY8093073.1 hypothetical protein [Paenibacillus polymyxa]WRL58906.1 hypothetical protein U3G77_11935 [Paenibacillus polymyxa]
MTMRYTRIKLKKEAYRVVQNYYGEAHFYRKSLMSYNNIGLGQGNFFFANGPFVVQKNGPIAKKEINSG